MRMSCFSQDHIVKIMGESPVDAVSDIAKR
jgi:hypothetical protein